MHITGHYIYYANKTKPSQEMDDVYNDEQVSHREKHSEVSTFELVRSTQVPGV
jgi:hypothetical protein